VDLPRLEHDIRQVPGVLACQVSGGEVVVLVAPDADADAVSGAVAALLTAAAASPIVRVVGGRSPIVAMRRRHARRAVAAFSAGAAALAAAGVAAATNGVFTPDRRNRPSVSSEVAAPPTTRGGATAPSTSPTGGVGDDEVRFERRARSASPTTTPASLPGTDVQPDRQLATLGVGAPVVLAFELPLPGEAAAPPVSHGPKKDVPVGPTVDATSRETTTTTTEPPPATTTTTPSTTTTTTTPTVGPDRPSSPSTTTPAVDQHDNDGGERGTDSNGHDTKGPQREGWQRGDRD
jgi:hypothetical protein